MRYVSLWVSVMIMLCIGSSTLADRETDTYIILGKQGQSLKSKDYTAYMKWFLPRCSFIDHRDVHRPKELSAAAWQQMIQHEIGDATVMKVETAPSLIPFEQYLTLKTPAGERKIIYLRLTYFLKKVPDGPRVENAYFDKIRTTTTGRYSDETALTGSWTHVEFSPPALLKEMDIEFYKDGTITLTPISGLYGGPVSGNYSLIDATHLRIEAHGTVEVWTIERPTLTPPARQAAAWNKELTANGIQPDTFVYKFPKNYYLILTTQDNRKVYVSR
ncbi:MAG: hypothetical protein JWN14_2644 [Chthonomonadales bacterium]|nr:hypothetical protein [Chthonomonadales bacterium]